ncbi:hypothetical protein B5S32_g4295 [[Candida] boidinii]|nr:hypothetical protein B5S32_g4295 [[Candida] boidinii]
MSSKARRDPRPEAFFQVQKHSKSEAFFQGHKHSKSEALQVRSAPRSEVLQEYIKKPHHRRCHITKLNLRSRP